MAQFLMNFDAHFSFDTSMTTFRGRIFKILLSRLLCTIFDAVCPALLLGKVLYTGTSFSSNKTIIVNQFSIPISPDTVIGNAFYQHFEFSLPD